MDNLWNSFRFSYYEKFYTLFVIIPFFGKSFKNYLKQNTYTKYMHRVQNLRAVLDRAHYLPCEEIHKKWLWQYYHFLSVTDMYKMLLYHAEV